MSETDRNVESVDDNDWSDMRFYLYLGSQSVAATLFLVAIAAIPLSMTDDQLTERRANQQADGTWKQEDVHPDFAFDERTFNIEPAAGPSNLD